MCQFLFLRSREGAADLGKAFQKSAHELQYLSIYLCNALFVQPDAGQIWTS